VRALALLLLALAGCAPPSPGAWDTGVIDARASTRRALLVAPDLDAPELGAAVSVVRMASALRQRGFVIDELEGEAATVGAVRATIRGSRADLREIGDDDRLLVYVIGHGGYEVDAARHARPVLHLAGDSVLPLDELMEEVDAVQGDAVVLDACLVGEPASAPWMATQPHRAHLLAAASPDEPAVALAESGGAYTAALVDALAERGGLVAAHELAAAQLHEHPPLHRGRPFDQHPTLLPGAARGEVVLDAAAAATDPPLLVDGLSRGLAGTGVEVVLDGAPLDLHGSASLGPGPHELHLARDGRMVPGTTRRRDLEPGDVLLLPAVASDAPALEADWLRPTVAEAPVTPTFRVDTLPIDCDVPEGLARVELDPDDARPEIFVGCRGDGDHPRYLVATAAGLEDRSERLGLDDAPSGGRPEALEGGVCYVRGVVGDPAAGPLACVGVDPPDGIHAEAPRQLDLDGDGAAERVLLRIGSTVVEDDGVLQPLGARLSAPVALRLDADPRLDLLTMDDGRIDGWLNLDGGWAQVLVGRVQGAGSGVALFDDGGPGFALVVPDNARDAAHILRQLPGRPLVVEDEVVEAEVVDEAGGGEQLSWIGADMDGDGRTDLVGARPATVLLRRDHGWRALDLGQRLLQVLPVDLDGDGDLDLVGVPESRAGLVVVHNDTPVRGQLRLRLDETLAGPVDVAVQAGGHRQRVRLDSGQAVLVLGLGAQEPDRVVLTGADGVVSRWDAGELKVEGPGRWRLDTRRDIAEGPRLLAGRVVVDLGQRPFRAKPWAPLDDLAALGWALRVGDGVAVQGQRADGRQVLRWLDGAGRVLAEQRLTQALTWPAVLDDRVVAHTDNPEGLVVANPAGVRPVELDRGGLRLAARAFGRTWLASNRTSILPLPALDREPPPADAPTALPCPSAGCVDREILVATPDGRDLFVIDTWRPGVERWRDGEHVWTTTMDTLRRPRPRQGASWDAANRRLLVPVEGGVDALVTGDSPTVTRPRVVEDGYVVDRVLGLGEGRLVTVEHDGRSRRLAVVDELAGVVVTVPLGDTDGDDLLVLPDG